MIATDLPSYSPKEAKAAYERGEREFIVWPAYPMLPREIVSSQKPCSKCVAGAPSVLYRHLEGKQMHVLCAACGMPLLGGYAELGIKGKLGVREKTKERDFSGYRWEILVRDRNLCFACHRGVAQLAESEELHIDHIIPFSQGGPTDPLNGIVLCSACNTNRGARLDEEYVTNALIHTHRAYLLQQGKLLTGHLGTSTVLRAVYASLKTWKSEEPVGHG